MSPAHAQSPGHALQSVGLVAEACRDQERAASQPKRVLTKQNSGGNIRAPPPYQGPPGPPSPSPPAPPPYKQGGQYTESPPGPPPYKQGGQYAAPPKHISPSYSATRYQEPGPQVEFEIKRKELGFNKDDQVDSATPKRPTSSKSGPPPPYGANIADGLRKMEISSSSSRPNSTSSE